MYMYLITGFNEKQSKSKIDKYKINNKKYKYKAGI